MASSPPPPGSEPALRKQWAGKQMDDWMVYATKKAERTDEEWKKIEEERSLKQAEVLPPARDFSLCGSFLQPGSRAALTRRHLALSDAAKRRLKRSWTRSRPSWRPRWPPAAVSSLQNVPQPAASLRTETPALALRVACLHHGVLGHVLSHLAAKEDGDQAFVAATEAVRAFGPPRPPPALHARLPAFAAQGRAAAYPGAGKVWLTAGASVPQFEEGDLETASAQWKVAAAKWGEAGKRTRLQPRLGHGNPCW